MAHTRYVRTIIAAALVAAAAPAFAQQADPRLSEERQPPGWSITPRLSTGVAYDDNVLIQGRGDDLQRDLNTAFSPGASLDYLAKRGALSADYRGAFQMYRDLGSLNSYEQSLNASARRVLTRHMLLFAQQSYSKTPTTELPLLAGVPFVRVGARAETLRGGAELTPLRHLSIAASYAFQWIAFDKDPRFGQELVGGHAHGGAVGAKYQISKRAMLTADYDLERAEVVQNGRFTVQNSSGGVDFLLDEHSHVFGALGVAHLTAADLGAGKTSPAWKAGYARRFQRFAVDAEYSRSFVPSYGGGGTLSNEELATGIRVPIGRRWYAEGNFSWRKNEPLVDTGLPLTSRWVGGLAGYALQPWLRLEAFYGGSHQNIERAGGLIDRHRAGIQIVTAKPVRIR